MQCGTILILSHHCQIQGTTVGTVPNWSTHIPIHYVTNSIFFYLHSFLCTDSRLWRTPDMAKSYTKRYFTRFSVTEPELRVTFSNLNISLSDCDQELRCRDLENSNRFGNKVFIYVSSFSPQKNIVNSDCIFTAPYFSILNRKKKYPATTFNDSKCLTDR